MGKISRTKLKNFFLKGNIPTEEQFHDLIDSGLNQTDDGIAKEQGEALKIKAEGNNEELLSFFKNLEDKTPAWSIYSKAPNGNVGLNFSENGTDSRLFIQSGGNIGVGTTSPNEKLDVNGYVAYMGRKGTYAQGTVPADGKWHNVVSNLNEFSLFEVVASSSKKGAHAIMHAIAASAYGNSKSKIRYTQGYFGRCRNCIELRFHGSYYDYSLQIRTKKNYDDGTEIKYNIAKLS